MIGDIATAFNDVFSRDLRPVFWRSIAITLALLIGAWFAVQSILVTFVDIPVAWMDAALGIFAGLVLFVGFLFLIPPVTSLIAGIFLDEIAGKLEAVHYPGDPPGKEAPILVSLVLAIKFTFVVIAVNIIALMLLLVPGINLIAFFVANGYLLGREYFTLAAQRFHERAEIKTLYRDHSLQIFLAGLAVAGFMAVPILNLMTPMFATALMVHVHKRLTGSERVSAPDR